MKTNFLRTLIINFLLVMVCFNSMAQFKKDTSMSSYLPKVGDWAIGIDATPFFQYAGNLFNQNGNTYVPSITFNAQYPNSIFFKMKVGNSTVIRSILIVGLSHTNDKIINLSDEENPHQLINSAFNIGGIVGVERTKSIRKRLLSYYGVQAGLQKKPYNNGSTVGTIEYIDKNDEELYFKEYGGTSLDIMLAPFLGLEFYLFPHFAISGEVAIDFNREIQKERYRKRGTAEKTIIDERVIDWGISPSASGRLGIFLYF